jgi:Uma2 family endonuclease
MRQAFCVRTSCDPKNEVFMAERAGIVPFDDGRICNMRGKRTATIEDLYRVDAKKAELVNGELVVMSPAGGLHTFAAGRIYASLDRYAAVYKSGFAMTDGVAYIVNLPHRRSFCPDAAFTRGPITEKFIDGAPVFAAEVRSEHDFGIAAEQRLARKRADYFRAGTQVVWDVDVLRNLIVRVFQAGDPSTPVIYRRGDIATAEPALPGWSMPVADLRPA